MTDDERERASQALDQLKAEAAEAADSISDAFDRAGESLAASLARAAADGEVSLSELARAVLTAVNAGAGQGLGAAVASAVSGLFAGGQFSGGRADSGPVSAGGAYLVGERGPEVFRPTSAGTVESVGGSSVTVNVSVAGGPQALLRSEAQIASMLARAAALGARRL